MDLTAIASGMSQIDLETKVGAALMSNVKELAEQQGEALVEMIESIPSPAGVGKKIDISL